MKRLTLFLLSVGIFCSATTLAQHKTLSTSYIKKHAAHFTLDNGALNGDGVKMITNMVRSSQFITYGETHNSKQISLFTRALMPFLKDADFNYFAIEVGPSSAKKLTELSTPAEKTMANLKAFNSKYTVSQGGETAEPIPFFTGVSDAAFLQEARKNNMQLWGLDQEYYYGTFYLLDELVNTAKDNPNYGKIQQLKNGAVQIMYKHFLDELAEKNDGAYALISKESAVNTFFNAFEQSNKEAQEIINSLKISWDIYIRWRDGSHQDRISYMRNNFMRHYEQAKKKERRPKVFTKIGSLHAAKLFSNGAFDIGNLTEELAQENGTMSTTINTWIPFSKTKDGVRNNLEKYKRSFGRYTVFTKLAKQDQWTIIDLRSIRKDIKKGKIKLPTNGDYHGLKNLIFSYDYQIMVPVNEKVVPNRAQ